MSDKKKKVDDMTGEETKRELNAANTEEIVQDGEKKEEYSLNDDRRVKVLSPGRLVAKRFFRNRMAMVGMIILIAMFLFSFLGGVISPYGENELFYRTEAIEKDYAAAIHNDKYRYATAEGQEFSSILQSQMILPMKRLAEDEANVTDSFTYSGVTYTVTKEGTDFYSCALADGTMIGIAYKDVFNPIVSVSYDMVFCALKAYTSGITNFTYEGKTYDIAADGTVTSDGKEVGAIGAEDKEYHYIAADGQEFGDLIQNEMGSALADFAEDETKESDTFEMEGETYTVTKEGSGLFTCSLGDGTVIGAAYLNVYTPSSTLPFEMVFSGLKAYTNQEKTFTYHNETYDIDPDGNVSLKSKEVGYISRYIVKMKEIGQLSRAFKDQLYDAIEQGEKEGAFKKKEISVGFLYTDADGSEHSYKLYYDPQTTQYLVKQDTLARVYNRYDSPSWEHWLGTDGYGMDILTRLMYGGRISLMIGFIVEIIATILGVIFGGISGYFGGWIDNLIMRIVDIFYCIPSLPIIIIIGAAMDQMGVEPKIRMIYLMLILGFLGWPGIARMVRGQILSLREQEFMTATEACGVRVSRRIYRHLIPNVIPQIIVSCTMGLGSTIITEATLSFLGLGVKFPFASWGNIISAIDTSYVFTNFWFVWIPAGMLLLLTVLAFNLVGDGLRDAFDPKMKR